MSSESGKPVEAKRVGASLVAAFHRADPPLVWRLDLERNHSFTLGLQGADGKWKLGLTPAEGDFKTVAHFVQRKDAEEALGAVENILAKGMPTFFDRALKPLSIVALLTLVVALVFGARVGMEILRMMPKNAPANAAAMSEAKPAAPMKTGVPLPADEYLTPPSQ